MRPVKSEKLMRLDLFEELKVNHERGVSRSKDALWHLAQMLFVGTSIPGKKLRVIVLRLFGAKIGKGAVIKTGIRVKFPWRLEIGDYCWLGESCWIDNFAEVKIGDHCCISQNAYICTGSHDWSDRAFELVSSPITIEDHVWVASHTKVAPGVTIGEGAVLCIGSVATHDLKPWTINMGVPAKEIKKRVMAEEKD